MTVHAIVIETYGGVEVKTTIGATWTTPRHYWWHCSCGAQGPSHDTARSARTGGQRHVAAMERGRDPFAVLRQPGKGGARTTEGREREIAKFERRAAIARGVMRRGEARGVGARNDEAE